MGRAKLTIKKIENVAKSRVTFVKRRNGLLKKAFELSTLCDIDVGLIIFSPSGKLTHFSKDDKIEEVISRFANTPQHEKTTQSFKTLEDLSKMVQKLHDERGLESPRVSYTTLQLQNQELKATLNRLYEERSLYEEQTLNKNRVHEKVEEPQRLEVRVDQREVDGSFTSVCKSSFHGGQALLDWSDPWAIELLQHMEIRGDQHQENTFDWSDRLGVEQPQQMEVKSHQQEVGGPSTSFCQSLCGGQEYAFDWSGRLGVEQPQQMEVKSHQQEVGGPSTFFCQSFCGGQENAFDWNGGLGVEQSQQMEVKSHQQEVGGPSTFFCQSLCWGQENAFDWSGRLGIEQPQQMEVKSHQQEVGDPSTSFCQSLCGGQENAFDWSGGLGIEQLQQVEVKSHQQEVGGPSTSFCQSLCGGQSLDSSGEWGSDWNTFL